MKIQKLYLYLILFPTVSLFVAARLFHLSKYGLWSDEVFSAQTAQLDWAALFGKVIYDVVHPPLFYAVLKVWMLIGGDSLIWLKLLPVLFAVSMLIPLRLLCRELKIGSNEFSLALGFIALNSYQIYFAQELRMYSLLALLSLWSMLLFVRFLKDESGGGRLEITLFVVNLLLVYTHYFGWLTIAAELLLVFFLQKNKLKRFSIHAFSVGACFLPWSYLVLTAALSKGGLEKNLSWLNKPRASDIFLFFAELQGTLPLPRATTVGFLLFLPPLLLWIWNIVRKRNSEDYLIFTVLSLFSALPVVVAFVASQILKTSVWSERYFIAAAVPYALLLAVGISRIERTRLRKAFLTLTILWTLGAGVVNIFYYRTRVDWTNISNRLVQSETGDGNAPVKIFVLEEWFRLPLQNSLDYTDRGKFEVEKIGDPNEANASRFWFGYRQTTWSEAETPRQKFEKNNCTVGNQTNDVLSDETIYIFFVECK